MDAVSLDIDALGLIFIKESPRYISPAKAEEISASLPPFVQLVGVFRNQSKEEIIEITNQCKLDLLQMHGQESPGFCLSLPRRTIKAFSLHTLEDLTTLSQYQGAVADALLDTGTGGTGKTFDWGLALKAKEFDLPIILAGGLNSTNVRKAIQLVNPLALDVSSCIEKAPGKKDYNKMKEFITLARG